jgi:hypothetical protein
MLLFRDEEHCGRWRRQWSQPLGAFLTIDQAWRLAQAWFGRKMERDWRRATLEETELLLAGLGLKGAFWDLRG